MKIPCIIEQVNFAESDVFMHYRLLVKLCTNRKDKFKDIDYTTQQRRM